MSTDLLKNISFFTLQNKDGNVRRSPWKSKHLLFTQQTWIELSPVVLSNSMIHICVLNSRLAALFAASVASTSWCENRLKSIYC